VKDAGELHPGFHLGQHLQVDHGWLLAPGMLGLWCMGGASTSLLASRNPGSLGLASWDLFSFPSNRACFGIVVCADWRSQRPCMSSRKHILGTEVAKVCQFAFCAPDWSQRSSLQDFGPTMAELE
jgi:hypothetical protein